MDQELSSWENISSIIDLGREEKSWMSEDRREEATRLLSPAVKANAEERAEAKVRAAAAFAGLCRPEEALAAMDAAAECLPGHAGLREDRDRMRRQIETGGDDEGSEDDLSDSST